MVKTNWKYSTETELEPLISEADYTKITKKTCDEQAKMLISVVSDVIRDYCGWHVSPSVKCYANCIPEKNIIHLPSLEVLSINKVTKNNEIIPAEQYEWKYNGSIKFNVELVKDWAGYDVEFVSGFEKARALTSAVAFAVAGAVTSPMGVKEEHAGNVGITYTSVGDSAFVPSKELLAVCARYKLPNWG